MKKSNVFWVDGQQMKLCTSCRQPKPLDLFPKSKFTKDGHSSWCKPCCRAATRRSLGKEPVSMENYVPRNKIKRTPDFIAETLADTIRRKAMHSFAEMLEPIIKQFVEEFTSAYVRTYGEMRQAVEHVAENIER